MLMMMMMMMMMIYIYIYIYAYGCLIEPPRVTSRELNWTPSFWGLRNTTKIGVSWPTEKRANMSKTHFFFCPWFLEVFKKGHFWRCRFVTSRKHYKNRGFVRPCVKLEKIVFFSECWCVLRRSARFRQAFFSFWASRVEKWFSAWGPKPLFL